MSGLPYSKASFSIARDYGEMRCGYWKPKKSEHPLPAVIWIHGGGFSSGSIKWLYRTMPAYASRQIPFVLISPSYRLMKGEGSGYPNQLEDCYACLTFVKENAKKLGIDPKRIVVGGESAGGNLAAAVVLKAHDEGIRLLGQILAYPMLDCRHRDFHKKVKPLGWTDERNQKAWKTYLGDRKPDAYASPSLREDYRGLPYTYAFVLDEELFYEETLEYVEKLREAGVEADLDVYKGKLHAFDQWFPLSKKSRVAKKRFAKRLGALLDRFISSSDTF